MPLLAQWFEIALNASFNDRNAPTPAVDRDHGRRDQSFDRRGQEKPIFDPTIFRNPELCGVGSLQGDVFSRPVRPIPALLDLGKFS